MGRRGNAPCARTPHWQPAPARALLFSPSPQLLFALRKILEKPVEEAGW